MAYYWTEKGAGQYGGSRDSQVSHDQLLRFGNLRNSGPSLQEAIDQGLLYQRDAQAVAAGEQTEEAAELAAATRERVIRGQVQSAFTGGPKTSFAARAFGSGTQNPNSAGGVASMVQRFMESI